MTDHHLRSMELAQESRDLRATPEGPRHYLGCAMWPHNGGNLDPATCDCAPRSPEGPDESGGFDVAARALGFAPPEGPDEALWDVIAAAIYADAEGVDPEERSEVTTDVEAAVRAYYAPLFTAERERVEAWIAEWYGCTSIADATRKGHQDDHECGGCSLRAALSATDPGSTRPDADDRAFQDAYWPAPPAADPGSAG